MIRVVASRREGIKKDARSFFEGHTVLSKVRGSLLSIPFETHAAILPYFSIPLRCKIVRWSGRAEARRGLRGRPTIQFFRTQMGLDHAMLRSDCISRI